MPPDFNIGLPGERSVPIPAAPPERPTGDRRSPQRETTARPTGRGRTSRGGCTGPFGAVPRLAQGPPGLVPEQAGALDETPRAPIRRQLRKDHERRHDYENRARPKCDLPGGRLRSARASRSAAAKPNCATRLRQSVIRQRKCASIWAGRRRASDGRPEQPQGDSGHCATWWQVLGSWRPTGSPCLVYRRTRDQQRPVLDPLRGSTGSFRSFIQECHALGSPCSLTREPVAKFVDLLAKRMSFGWETEIPL